MKHLSAFLALLVGIFAQAAPPASVNAFLLDSNNLPNLGAQISWAAVPGASYSVYGKEFQYKHDCTQVKNWDEITSTLSVATTYDDYPPADAFGWGGYWCYGVSATVNGVESAITPLHWPVAMGAKWYVLWFYDAPDCSGRLGGVNPPAPGTLVITRTRSGQAQQLPFVIGTGQPPYRFAGFARFLSYDDVTVQLTLPDGKVLNFPHAFKIPGVSVVDDAAPYLILDLSSADDRVCEAQTWMYDQQGTNNF